jgi:hypothetical protein
MVVSYRQEAVPRTGHDERAPTTIGALVFPAEALAVVSGQPVDALTRRVAERR